MGEVKNHLANNKYGEVTHDLVEMMKAERKVNLKWSNDNRKSLEISQKHYLGNNLVKVLHRRLQSSIDTTVMGFTKAGITSTTGESRHFYVHPC